MVAKRRWATAGRGAVLNMTGDLATAETVVNHFMDRLRTEQIAVALCEGRSAPSMFDPRIAGLAVASIPAAQIAPLLDALLDATAIPLASRANLFDALCRARADLAGEAVHVGGSQWSRTVSVLRTRCRGDLVLIDSFLAAAGAPVAERFRACGLRP